MPNKLPIARSADIVVQTIGSEILIYDLNTHKAYHLNESCAIVYQACDGKTTFDELKRSNKFTDDLIFLALDQLKADELIRVDESFVSPLGGLSRREAIRRVGLASMVVLPVVASMLAPTAAMAQSVAACANPGGRAAGQGFGSCEGSTIFTNASTCGPVCATGSSACCSGNTTVGACTTAGSITSCRCLCA
jgi:hypothetical protein